MKSWIHPTVYNTKVSCTCWAKFEFMSTMSTMKVETCSKCHTFYTWIKRDDNRASRVTKFRERQATAQKKTAKK